MKKTKKTKKKQNSKQRNLKYHIFLVSYIIISKKCLKKNQLRYWKFLVWFNIYNNKENASLDFRLKKKIDKIRGYFLEEIKDKKHKKN